MVQEATSDALREVSVFLREEKEGMPNIVDRAAHPQSPILRSTKDEVPL
jgi:hypothetical protein